jgi:regulator of protease activity HflC (stomatin/prohibitin superfamily)
MRILRFLLRLLITVIGLAALLAVLTLLGELYQARLNWARFGQLVHRPGLWGQLCLGLLLGLLAGMVALFLTAGFVRNLYHLNTFWQALGHLVRCVFGQPRLAPLLRVLDGRIVPDDAQHVLVRLGGPGTLIVSHDSGVVLARGGRLTRVLEPGTLAALEPFERIYDVVDVRPMRREWRVRALSREGIPVVLPVVVDFQVDTADQWPTRERPYPATPEAILRVATQRLVCADDGSTHEQSLDWAQRLILNDVEQTVRNVVARYPLNVLIAPPQEETVRLRQELERELLDTLRGLATPLGVRVNRLRLGAICAAESVQAHWVEAWLNRRAYQVNREHWLGAIQRETWPEVARATAEMEVIYRVADAFKDLSALGKDVPARTVLMRLLEVFDRAPLGEMMYVPDHALNTLERLRKLLG